MALLQLSTPPWVKNLERAQKGIQSMIHGTITAQRPVTELKDRLSLLLAASNCKILRKQENAITFTQGSYQAQSAPLLPKVGRIVMSPTAGTVKIDWEIRVQPFVAAWMTFIAVAFCFTVFAPIRVYRALKVEPRIFIENLLLGFL